MKKTPLHRLLFLLLLTVATCFGICGTSTVLQGQDSPCFEPVKTAVLKVNSKPVSLDVELNGAEDLYLVATFGPDNYDSDQAVWASPTLYDENGAATDMTTLKPVSAKTGWGSLILNRDHQGNKIKLGGVIYEKGFFAHAPSILHFKLNGKFRRFTACVGLVESAQRGSCSFEVYPYPVEMPSRDVYARNYDQTSSPLEIIPAADKSTVHFNAHAAQRLLDQGIEELVFVRHIKFTSNHVYTDHVNSRWAPGGGLAILNLKTGKARDVNPALSEGVIHRFDLSFDAKKIVFDWKKSTQEGFRIYEINVDGTGLKQLTFPPDNEDALHKQFHAGGYHRGTDDMQPCYLPDGGIAFISTRCLFSVLCDSGDVLTVTNLYRMNGDGSEIIPLTFSALSEQSPAMLPDGRILYHRWEYLDKAAGNVKALWAVNPDGTNSSEIYGNTITFPECMIYARPILGQDKTTFTNKIVMIGASHCCPNNAVGTVIVIDTKGNVRSPETMRYITKEVAAFHHNGFHFLNDKGEWVHDKTGRPGRLFKDPYPMNENLFIVSCKPKGLSWNEPAGYALALIDGEGADETLYKDESVSCWLPYPLTARPVPPVRPSVVDENLAKENRAVAVMTDVYAGMDNVERGKVKYLRVLEQIPRSWYHRKRYGQDHQGTTHAHSAIGSGHLSVKVQLGIVPVEPDGSARFYVPADRAVYFQALDEQYRAIQSERTYVNFRPGETRSCVGCHETPNNTPTRSSQQMPQAMSRPISVLQPQPNQTSGYLSGAFLSGSEQTFDYDRQIQPILDKYCISCHGAGTDSAWNDKIAGNLDLRGKPEVNYCVSYNQMNRLAGKQEKQLWGNRAERNEDAAMNGIEYIPPYHIGALSSPLSAWLTGVPVSTDQASVREYAKKLSEVHPAIKLSSDELLTINNWLDVNCPYHPSYFGRLHADFADSPNFRPVVSPSEAKDRQLPKRFSESGL